MANLLATFRLADEMSSKLEHISSSGDNAVKQWESAGNTADSAFAKATGGATQTAHSVDGVASSLNGFKSSSESATSSADYWTDAIGNYNREAMRAIYSTEELVEQGYMSADALDTQTNAADKAADKIDDYGKQSEEAGKKSQEFGNKSINAIQDLSQIVVAAGIARGLKAIYDGFMDCSDAAAVFEVANAKVETAADTAKASIDDMSSELLDISNDAGKAVLGLSDAVYQAISAGVDTVDSIDFAGTANKLAVGGFTEAATSVDVLTTAINAYNLESEDAAEISDMLIVTQNLGKTTVNELSSSVGKVIPLAAAYNVEMDNLSTAYAQLTVGGIATAEAGTYLKSMLSELGDSSSDVAKTLQEETGQSFAMLMDRGYSLGDVLETLGGSVDGDTTKFNELWSSTEAGVGALALFNSGADEFNSVLEQMQDSAGATEKAYNTMSDTTAHAQEKMMNAADNVKIVIGDQLNPVLTELYDVGAVAFDWAGGFLEKHPAVTAGLVGISTSVGIVAVGLTGFALVTSPMVVTAITSITTAMTANPVFLIATGVVALTAATVAFVSVLSSHQSEYDTWTATTQKEYDNLQSLNSEYDKACEQFGETSTEALRLRYQVDELSASFETNKQTVEEYLSECDATIEAHSKMINGYEDGIDQINKSEIGTLALIQKLEDLATATYKTSAAEEQMKAIIAKLNKDMPDLALSYEKVISNTDSMVDSLERAAKAQAEQNQFEKSQEAYTTILEEQATLKDKIADAEEKINLERQRLIDKGEYTGDDGPWVKWRSNIDEYQKEMDGFQAAQAENEGKLAGIEEQWGDIEEAAKAAANAPVTYEEDVRTSIDGVKTDMDELILKYDEAYQEARSSIDSTIGLFDNMKTQTELSISDMTKAMDSQVAYLERYTDNIKKAAKYGIDDGLVASLSDGSEESAGYIDAIVKKIDELGVGTENAKTFIENFNGSFEKVSTAKDNFTATQKLIGDGFGEALDEMEEKLKKSVDNMNMGTEAATAAKDTLSEYIASIKAQQGEAVSAAEAVASAVSKALETTSTVKYKLMNPSPNLPWNQYASGTANAPAGFALVGEEGPELVNFNGGEVVYPADDTNRIISSISNDSFKTSVPDSIESAGARIDESNSKTEKRITLEISGSGELDIGEGVSKDMILSVMIANLKPALMSIIKQEIYEEGDLSYDY